MSFVPLSMHTYTGVDLCMSRYIDTEHNIQWSHNLSQQHVMSGTLVTT